MVLTIVYAFLWSISPLGEAKVGIPYAMHNGVNIYLAFAVCLGANLLVFPLMNFFLDSLNSYFIRWRPYKRSAVYVARRAKTGAGKGIQKYGFWGLILFVAIPLPGTGVYAGTIAAYLFQIERKKAFLANSIGILISSIVVWSVSLLALEGLK